MDMRRCYAMRSSSHGRTCGVHAAQAQVVEARGPHLLVRLLPRVAEHLRRAERLSGLLSCVQVF